MRISDWSSDVCSSDLDAERDHPGKDRPIDKEARIHGPSLACGSWLWLGGGPGRSRLGNANRLARLYRSEEHTSELQSLMRSSYAVFCLKKKRSERLTRGTEYRTNNKKRTQRNKP